LLATLSQDATAPDSEARRVLVVDDDGAVVTALGRLLSSVGFEVVGAASAEEALANLETAQPQVVMADYYLPGMDGVDFLEQVGNRDPIIQRILVSGSTAAVDAAVQRSHVYRFVSKPWEVQSLIATIRSAMSQYDLASEHRRLLDLARHQNAELRELARSLEERVTQRTAALSQAKRQWEETFDAIADPLMILTGDYRVLRANVAMARDLGRPFQAIIGEKCHDLRALARVTFPAEAGKPCSGCPVGPSGQIAEPRSAELVSPGGRTYEISAFPLRSMEGLSLVCAYRDVTEARSLQQQVAQADKLAAIGQLAGGVAHEVNNPLGGILAFAQLLKRRIAVGAVGHEEIDEIEQSALRCKRIVEGLLRFSRLARPEERHAADLNEIVGETLVLVRRQYSVASVAIDADLGADLVPVLCNANQIQQVLLNLLQNAFDAMPAGGTIRVTTAAAPGAVVLSVADEGSGIHPESLSRIFDPFFTTKAEGKGTGLGLAVSAGIVRGHGGRLSVASTPGKGTTFTLLLPAAEHGGELGAPGGN
jgi:two-component system, NtrC family, sensor kinase